MQQNQQEFTRKEVFNHRSFNSCWIILYNNVYDITLWIPKHPGGNLIRQGSGIDCTGLFESTHPPYVNEEFIKKYKIGTLKKEEHDTRFNYKTELWKTIKKRVWNHFKDNNINPRDCSLYYFNAFLLSFLFICFYILSFYYSSYIFTIISAFIASICGICVSHDGLHGAASNNPKINHFTGWYMDFFGGSGYIWKHIHNIGHHQYTNTESDPDSLTGTPIVRLSEFTPHKYYHKYQHIYIWFLYIISGINWNFTDYINLIDGNCGGIELYPMSKVEIIVFYLGKFLNLLYCFIIPLYYFGFIWGIIYFLTFQIIEGYYTALVFAVNHRSDEVYWPTNIELNNHDWAKLQIMTSANYSNNSTLVTFLTGGINFQIEHHLFPSISHLHYKNHIAPIIKEICKENNIPYTTNTSYYKALKTHYNHLYNLGNP